MTIKGKLVQLLPLQTGEGKNGVWKKQEVILETEGQYPKKVCIAFWGDKINEQLLQIGNEVNVSFDIESREYNGRWYTDVKAWKVDLVSAGGGEDQSDASYSQPSSGDYNQPSAQVQDDLPF